MRKFEHTKSILQSAPLPLGSTVILETKVGSEDITEVTITIGLFCVFWLYLPLYSQYSDGTYEAMGYSFNLPDISDNIIFDSETSKLLQCTIEKLIERITQPKAFSSMYSL